ncbi:10759_t:CDS:2, partial [Entrophospora sp. SA101]
MNATSEFYESFNEAEEFLPNDGTIILEDIYHLPLPIFNYPRTRKCFSQIYELHCDNIFILSMCSNKLFINENDHNKKNGGLIIRKLVIKDLKSDNRGLAYLISLQKYLECVVYGS